MLTGYFLRNTAVYPGKSFSFQGHLASRGGIVAGFETQSFGKRSAEVDIHAAVHEGIKHGVDVPQPNDSGIQFDRSFVPEKKESSEQTFGVTYSRPNTQ